jgi:hypothetical protein
MSRRGPNPCCPCSKPDASISSSHARSSSRPKRKKYTSSAVTAVEGNQHRVILRASQQVRKTPLVCVKTVELRGFEPLTPSMRTKSGTRRHLRTCGKCRSEAVFQLSSARFSEALRCSRAPILAHTQACSSRSNSGAAISSDYSLPFVRSYQVA